MFEYPEQFKEPSEPTFVGRPLPPFRKRWKHAETKLKCTYYHSLNLSKEQFYMKMLKEVKQLYATLYERAFEKDYRELSKPNPFLMHCFMTSSFLFELECDFNYRYAVHYDIYQSPFETQIMNMLDKYKGALEPVLKKREPDLPTSFNNVEAHSGSDNFYILSPDTLQ